MKDKNQFITTNYVEECLRSKGVDQIAKDDSFDRVVALVGYYVKAAGGMARIKVNKITKKIWILKVEGQKEWLIGNVPMLQPVLIELSYSEARQIVEHIDFLLNNCRDMSEEQRKIMAAHRAKISDQIEVIG